MPAALSAGGGNYLTSWEPYHWPVKSLRRPLPPALWAEGADRGGGDSPRFSQAAEHLSPTIAGEAIPTVGKGVAAEEEGYDGIIAIGPFNCLPFRISEAILKPHSLP